MTVKHVSSREVWTQHKNFGMLLMGVLSAIERDQNRKNRSINSVVVSIFQKLSRPAVGVPSGARHGNFEICVDFCPSIFGEFFAGEKFAR